jgi:hypothetical protein
MNDVHRDRKGVARPRYREFLLILWLANLLAMAAIVLVAQQGIGRFEAATAEYRAELDRLRSLSDGTRIAQVEFKTQVQEWKNILLRGHDPQQFQRFLSAFMSRNGEIQEQLGELIDLAKSAGFPDRQIVELRERHQELLASYRDGLSRFQPDDPLSVRLVDDLMRGLDRTLSTRFDRFAAMVDGFGDASVNAFSARVAELGATLRLTLLVCSIVAVLLLGLTVVLTVRAFASRAAKPEPS